MEIRYSDEKKEDRKDKGEDRFKKSNPNVTGPTFGIFIGNMSYKTTTQTLEKAFKNYGEIAAIRIATGQDGRPRGFAHIDFVTEEARDKALEKNGKQLDGRELRVDKSENKQGGRGGNAGGKPRRGGFGGNKGNSEAKAIKSGAIPKSDENKGKVQVFESDDDE